MPHSPIRLVIGFSPGSASHDAALLAAPRLRHALRREVTLAFIPGESGVRAARHVAAAAPDGTTLLLCTLGLFALQPNLRPDCGFDPLADFAPIGLLVEAPLVLAAAPSLGLDSVTAVLTAARSGPGSLAYASSAFGGAPHLAGALFAARAGVTLRHAVYTDTRDLYRDLESGAVPLSFNNIASMAARLADGRLTGLATTGPTRPAELPDLPTLDECGLPDCVVTNWVGLAAPSGTDVKALAAAIGADPAVFAAHLRQEHTRWRHARTLLADAP